MAQRDALAGDEFLVYLTEVETEDAALYQRKDTGQNGVTVYQENEGTK